MTSSNDFIALFKSGLNGLLSKKNIKSPSTLAGIGIGTIPALNWILTEGISFHPRTNIFWLDMTIDILEMIVSILLIFWGVLRIARYKESEKKVLK